ncbi:MAG: hypothetical protein A2381_14955 [Bdellovibrionales bacterium RIFOXYB1_FULL_37_110]|nr:MAG: hypothetical protein A2417_10460 [Bdellovibrionales bacterium RIFOXYC1_FULL_37_79]OFZ60164.1 MAG: hypothetical protein A2381_14955 [Bdellovibrionales bacterium RIFOXYB1_FULL_37_110]OFZ64342.1 MAG: hypothetical protein A2577_09815 [Bdellovibrionales bacterium RIFOXYD1_FULL_36_51]
MKLVILAHKLEARHFFFNYSFKKNPDFLNLYEHAQFNLFICQMGPIQALQNLTTLLEKINNFDLIINLGISGALNHALQPDSIVAIKTLTDASAIFHPIDTPDGIYTCLTSENKILTPIDAATLTGIDLIDMEACGLFQASHTYKIPFYSYKLISDFPHHGANEDFIKSNFDTYSKLLFDYFKQQILPLF